MTVAWLFGDSFDLYSQPSDVLTYWDGVGTAAPANFTVGRFTGSQAAVGGSGALVKSSGSNDAIHHVVFATANTNAIIGTSVNAAIDIRDGTTTQCSINLRSDGTILLTASSGGTGTVLATYSGALTAINTWYAFEIEVVVNNTTGSFKVRKNGNTVDDFSATSLNTRNGTANSYANQIKVVLNQSSSPIDDFLWRSDPSSVPWVGDVRAWVRPGVSDSSVQFTRSASVVLQTPLPSGSGVTMSATVPRYTQFTPTTDGTIGTLSIYLSLSYTGNMKCSIYSNSGSNTPGTVLGSATAIVNPVAGANAFTFGTPVAVTRGTQYWIGVASDTTQSATWQGVYSTTSGTISTTGATGTGSPAYSAFPATNPAVSTGATNLYLNVTITPSTVSNAMLVADVPLGGGLTYVSSSIVGDADFYVPAAIAVTPGSVVAVVTRAYAEKTDAGTRNIQLQVKSAGTTSSGASTALNTTFGWITKTDQVDPNTSAAWTATGVNNMTFGPKTSA